MAVMFMMEFPNVGKDKYDQIMKELGLDKRGATWPTGIRSHTAGAYPGGWAVMDVWASEATFGKFRQAKLAPAMQKVGGIPEPRVTTATVAFTHSATAGPKSGPKSPKKGPKRAKRSAIKKR
jgi:hypothetical protein